jgi:hypothetical protein
MSEPGEHRPPGMGVPTARSRRATGPIDRLNPRSSVGAIVLALGLAVLTALGWALLRGILELTIGLLAVAGFGGWAIGAALRIAPRARLLAAAIAAGTWVAGLVSTWLVAMAILPGSSRTFFERVEHTPFVDWLSPQFGLLELAGLLLLVGAAVMAAGPRASPRARS